MQSPRERYSIYDSRLCGSSTFYIRTDANVADEPSRADLSGARYELGAEPAAGIAAFTHSKPVCETVLPSLDECSSGMPQRGSVGAGSAEADELRPHALALGRRVRSRAHVSLAAGDGDGDDRMEVYIA